MHPNGKDGDRKCKMKTACLLNRPWVDRSDQTKQSTRQLQGLSSVLSLTEVVRAGNDFRVAKSTSDNNFFNGGKKTDSKMTRRMIERSNILGVSNVVALHRRKQTERWQRWLRSCDQGGSRNLDLKRSISGGTCVSLSSRSAGNNGGMRHDH